jgi:glycosyltransferase involved in cell wall biosynthesis
MRILLCTPQPVLESLGISRILMRLADELRGMHHEAEILGPEGVGCTAEYMGTVGSPYAAALRAHLFQHAREYDVVEYDHEFFPFPRADFEPRTLFVARSVLLAQHLETIRIPERRTLRAIAGRIVRGPKKARLLRERIVTADATLRSADLVNLANPRDRDEVVRRGIAPARVAVIPYALASEVRAALGAATKATPPHEPIVAFIGTFDYRKGATTFGPMFERLVQAVPRVRLRLLGCKGMFTDERTILSFFPRTLRSRVEIKMTFPREKLAELLSDCSVGVFPSYVESFGLGVLEMMSAHLPVVAFDAPGPPVMVPSDLLVPPGDAERMASVVAGLLLDRERLERERARARAIAETFTWERVARETVDAYQAARERLA